MFKELPTKEDTKDHREKLLEVRGNQERETTGREDF